MEDYNYKKLLGRIKEKGYSQDRLAEQIGISATSMNLSLNNKRDFKQNEILEMCKKLEIDLADISMYFFNKIL